MINNTVKTLWGQMITRLIMMIISQCIQMSTVHFHLKKFFKTTTLIKTQFDEKYIQVKKAIKTQCGKYVMMWPMQSYARVKKEHFT